VEEEIAKQFPMEHRELIILRIRDKVKYGFHGLCSKSLTFTNPYFQIYTNLDFTLFSFFSLVYPHYIGGNRDRVTELFKRSQKGHKNIFIAQNAIKYVLGHTG
jgi:hypothetical protein